VIKKITIIIFLAGIFLAVDFAQDLIYKFLVEKAVKTATGLDIEIGHFRLGVLSKQFIDIKGLRIFNPDEFEDSVLADAPAVYADYNLSSVLSDRIQIRDMRVELKEFLIARNKQGVLNLKAFKISESKSSRHFAIARLRLKISKIVFKDYSKTPTVIREYNLNLNEEFRNLDGIHSVVRIVIVKAVTGTAIKNLIKFNLDSIQKPVASALSGGTKIFDETTKNTAAVIKGTGGILRETFHAIFGRGKAAEPK